MKAQHIHAKDVQELEKVRINSIGSSWNFHYGKITSLGNTDICLGGRDVDIQWDGAPASGMCGAIPDGKWEIFKLAFAGSGRIRILSDKQATSDWMFDYRYLDALKKKSLIFILYRSYIIVVFFIFGLQNFSRP